MPVHRVHIETIEERLCDPCPEATRTQLLSFGHVMLDEVRDRTNVLDTKGTTIVGTGGALVAFLLVSVTTTHSWWLRLAIVTPTIIGVFAVLRAFLAIRLQDWDWPSEQDWFRSDLFLKPDALQRYHLLSLLETHRIHNDKNAKKYVHLAFCAECPRFRDSVDGSTGDRKRIRWP